MNNTDDIECINFFQYQY
ncbi:hypothetical protein c7_L268 [Megavirus courdo7]|uniref:Uncharacterized protein n=1 Tax=Megavirus courdo7 TaxID=1128135 RepID=H2EAB1_9VIRU|nr:hypothetical protein c7_L268 [Megavirus courdo7]